MIEKYYTLKKKIQHDHSMIGSLQAQEGVRSLLENNTSDVMQEEFDEKENLIKKFYKIENLIQELRRY